MAAWILAGLSLPASALGAPRNTALDPERLARAFESAARLPKLQALIVARHGTIQAERRFRGPSLDAPVNVNPA